MSRWMKIIIGIIVIVLNVSCDQITKSVVRSEVISGERIDLIKNHLILTKVENTGAFLSFGDHWIEPIKIFFLIALPIVFLIIGLYFMIKWSNRNIWLILSIGFVVGGGIGNMIDRVLYQSVTDFLHIRMGPIQSGIFNMADVSIIFGMGILLIYLTRGRLRPI